MVLKLKFKVNLNVKFINKVNISVNGHTAYCLSFDVARESISIHQPIWRFIGGLFCAPDFILRNYRAFESDEKPEGEENCINLVGVRALLMEMPLRFFIFIIKINIE